MSVVVDSNLLIALVLNDPRAAAVDRRFRAWTAAGETLHAPELLRYEVANALTRSVVAGQLATSRVAYARGALMRLQVTLHELTDGAEAVAMALRLERSSAYDAAYLVLAQSLNAELWTLDGPLFRNAGRLGFPVRLVTADPG